MDRKILGKRIKEERIRIGLTQEQLAEYLDVSTTYVGFIERGERSVTLEKLALLAQCFHVTIDSLLQEPPTKNTPKSVDEQFFSLWESATLDEKKLILSIGDVVVNRKYL